MNTTTRPDERFQLNEPLQDPLVKDLEHLVWQFVGRGAGTRAPGNDHETFIDRTTQQHLAETNRSPSSLQVDPYAQSVAVVDLEGMVVQVDLGRFRPGRERTVDQFGNSCCTRHAGDLMEMVYSREECSDFRAKADGPCVRRMPSCRAHEGVVSGPGAIPVFHPGRWPQGVWQGQISGPGT